MQNELELIKRTTKSVVLPNITPEDLMANARQRFIDRLNFHPKYANIDEYAQWSNLQIINAVYPKEPREFFKNFFEKRAKKNILRSENPIAPLWFFFRGRILVTLTLLIFEIIGPLVAYMGLQVYQKNGEIGGLVAGITLWLLLIIVGSRIGYLTTSHYFKDKKLIAEVRQEIADRQEQRNDEISEYDREVGTDSTKYLSELIDELQFLEKKFDKEKKLASYKLNELVAIPLQNSENKLVELKNQVENLPKLADTITKEELSEIQIQLEVKIRETEKLIASFTTLNEFVAIEEARFEGIKDNLHATIQELTKRRTSLLKESKLLEEIRANINSPVGLDYPDQSRYMRDLQATLNRLTELGNSLTEITAAAQESIKQLPGAENLLLAA